MRMGFAPTWLRQVKVKVKEADLYSAFIEVPYTQGAGELPCFTKPL